MDFTFHRFGLERKLSSPSPSRSVLYQKSSAAAGEVSCGRQGSRQGAAARPRGRRSCPLRQEEVPGQRAVTQCLGLTHTHTNLQTYTQKYTHTQPVTCGGTKLAPPRRNAESTGGGHRTPTRRIHLRSHQPASDRGPNTKIIHLLTAYGDIYIYI